MNFPTLPGDRAVSDRLDLNIPNTTNSIEGMFSGIKKKLRNHAGLREFRKFKILDYLLSK